MRENKIEKAINNPDAQAAFLQIRFDTMINKTAKQGKQFIMTQI